MMPAFIINNRNKGAHVYKAVRGALSQTVPCEIIISDQSSTDNSLAEIERAIAECPRGADHEVRVLHCPIAGPSCMETGNKHIQWCVLQTKANWIFQCSADDYSLPDRVKVCMEAVEKNPCSAVATTMFFMEPGTPLPDGTEHVASLANVSGYPTESGYVHAGEGIPRLAYGSVIAGYSREFLELVGHGGPNTIDVLFGYAAALRKGFYVVADPQHVHVLHKGADNMGMGGRMLAADGDEALRLAELNQMQLFRLYRACLAMGQKLCPEGIPQEHLVPLLNQMIGQAIGWLDTREVLREKGVTPGLNA